MREISKLHNDQTISNEIADEDRIDVTYFLMRRLREHLKCSSDSLTYQ
jgi:hypothetical protein